MSHVSCKPSSIKFWWCLGVTIEGDVMLPHIIERSLRLNSKHCVKLLATADLVGENCCWKAMACGSRIQVLVIAPERVRRGCLKISMSSLALFSIFLIHLIVGPWNMMCGTWLRKAQLLCLQHWSWVGGHNRADLWRSQRLSEECTNQVLEPSWSSGGSWGWLLCVNRYLATMI